MRVLVMHERQEPKKGVGAGETVRGGETASSSLHCVPDLKPIARPPENLLLAGLDTEWVEYMVQVLLIHYWAFKILICTNPI